MRAAASAIPEVLILEPTVFDDERGFFFESYNRRAFRQTTGIDVEFVQDNHSRSRQGVLRGLHFQVRRPQAQIVTVIRGRIFDVVVDLRPASPTFGRWFGTELDENGPCQIYMTPGFAHGFCVLSELADLHYKVSEIYDHTDEGGLLWSDPDIGIRWPNETPVVSVRDNTFPRLRDLDRERLPQGQPDDLNSESE